MRRGPGICLRSCGLVALSMVLATSGIGSPSIALADSNRLHMTAMTYNLFQGSELSDVVSATSATQLLAAVAKDYSEVVTTNFSERAAAIAAEVQSAGPDLIGLQEAALWKTGAPSAIYPPPPPTTVSYDLVAMLVQALNDRGLHYAPVAVTNNFTVAGPGLFQSGFMNVQLTDRVAILARTDEALMIANVRTANFIHNTVLTTLTGPNTLTGGYASVDAAFGSRTERFVTTHLDPFDLTVGAAQANELVHGPLNTDVPVTLTCDCNATPSSAVYALLTGAGLKDSWSQAAGTGQPGYTCCQIPTLLDPTSTLASRIDYIFTRGGGLRATDVEVLGADQASRSTPSGFWPSDHAGLAVTFIQGSAAG
jgi:endonuclease/exonuclease/phosphatase family metal-dependent hydrolase